MNVAKVKTIHSRYSVVIQWSEEDQVYIASLPEWGPYAKTHGTTYEEAAKNAQEVLELLMEGDNGKTLHPPVPSLFHSQRSKIVGIVENLAPKSDAKTATKKARKSA